MSLDIGEYPCRADASTGQFGYTKSEKKFRILEIEVELTDFEGPHRERVEILFHPDWPKIAQDKLRAIGWDGSPDLLSGVGSKEAVLVVGRRTGTDGKEYPKFDIKTGGGSRLTDDRKMTAQDVTELGREFALTQSAPVPKPAATGSRFSNAPPVARKF